MDRRTFLAAGAALAAGAQPKAAPQPTKFLVACMTLPYARFPLVRALKGVQAAGYKYVAWGTTHAEEGGKSTPVLAADAPPERAKELAARCKDLGLETVMMFSGIYPEAKDGLEVLTHRVKQAGAAGVPQVLTFGHTKGGDRKVWVERLKALGPVAKDHNVTLVVKQHGGDTGTGVACAGITREVDHPNVKVNYDAGNVLDYLNKDPIPDIRACAGEVRSFCIKDHRNWPRDEDCGPGFGEIDHYKLLAPVAFTGLTIPLACENISVPLLPRPDKPEDVDANAKRAREFLELVLAGLQAAKLP
ncbi:sugar phosphate isomerase/epimerase family protein [Gemmata sp.]|uniref:sugar phosphate isomerase/epimerase family protein n=1 Tax=Gemmata sp. TaxID=1914242 RepID=UPI003F706AA4